MSGTPMQTRFGCYIGNIDRSVTIDMLKQVFCQCGTIIDCSLNGREGDPYRFGFIDFATEDDRARAMKYNGFTLVGRKLKVGVSKGNVNKPEGYATGNSAGGAHARMGGNRNYHNDGGMMNVNGLSPQQQMEARLLLQFLQEGKMDPRQLSPAQQQLLITCLGHGNNNAVNGNSTNGDSSMPASTQQPQMGVMGSSAMQSPLPLPSMQSSGNMMGDAAAFMPNPNTGSVAPGAGIPMMGGGVPQGIHINMGPSMMDTMSGGYGMMPPRQPQPQQWGDMPMNGAGMYPPKMCGPSLRQQPQMPMQPGQQQPYGLGGGAASISASGTTDYNRGGFINPPPAAETLKLREKQREQFFEVVRKEAEKCERKLQEKKSHPTGSGEAERSADSSASDDEDKKPTKKSRKEASR
ncbi:RNA-binding protein, putative [Leishmania tarentolae]|uniref:RNA-binding protein, putative n=1 Tax=Leishmania tarentolae TaxID=5689 RepID=A0A640KEW0_LEITA|nr:RNA-binding protein, putative [Leishmania tarentolae]